MIIGIIIVILSLLDEDEHIGWPIGGFLLSAIGTGMYAAGNRRQGRDTTFFGGGFVTTDG